MRRFRFVILLVFLVGCRDAFRTHTAVVARVGDEELTVDRMAGVFAETEHLGIQRDLIDQFAWYWVDLKLFAERVVAGDSMVDSATVFEAMWPDVRQDVIYDFHEQLVEERVRLDSAGIDSVYQHGDRRFFAHVLRRVRSETTPEEKQEQRRTAERIRRALLDGGSWSEANEQNEDFDAGLDNGSLRIVGRGETVPAFENAAFALASGELSEVVETQFGFHVIYRPPLDAIREQYVKALELTMVAEFDTLYEAQLIEDQRVEFRPRAAAIIREGATHPVRALGSSRVIATYRNGRFTVGDLVRWLQRFPIGANMELVDAPDDQLEYFARSLIVQELLWRQADSAGISVTDSLGQWVNRQFRRQLASIRSDLGLVPESLVVAATPGERERMAATRVDEFWEAVVRGQRRGRKVPPFLSSQLRAAGDWEVVFSGVERVLEQAAALRAELELADSAEETSRQPE